MVKKAIIISTLSLCLLLSKAEAQKGLSANNGHSHNDYHQHIPLLSAYYARMGSIEADVFLKNGKLYVAHDTTEISEEATLKSLYLAPLAKFYAKNDNHPYPDSTDQLQLVIDIKSDYQHVLPVLINELREFNTVFNHTKNPAAITIAVSGDVPDPASFKNYPDYISFDGRPYITYTQDQLKRICMISDELKNYTDWNGKGTPTKADEIKLRSVIDKAHRQHKPFRFWATQDSPNTWLELERLGVDWINTDHPEQLHNFYQHKDKLSYTNPLAYPVYQPTYKSDGLHKKVKHVILLIGDGMGLAQIHAGWIANHGNLNITMMRNSGFSQTAAANSGNTDSAAGATAMAAGEKTNNRYIGMGPDDRHLTNMADTLAIFGVKTGIISSGDITDATPAAFYAHQPDRSFNQAIAKDFLSSHVDVLVGSNERSFLANADTTLMSAIKAKGYTWSSTLTDFKKQKRGKQLVLLPDSATRPVKDGRDDMLLQSLNKTIELLSSNKNGFFIMTEGAQIDYGGHANDLKYVVTELHDFDKTVAEALRFADRDGETLVLVTADHETGGLTLLEAAAAEGRIQGEFSTNDHTNIMVPVYAYGPWAEEFRGTYQNTEIFHKILKAFSNNKP
ncbi:alkaline phosphatase [Pedobacter sp. MR2016-24]|uniref:alkaline phosphatase n=1 Tax=Pedobacter sp. MR2016-24 TaxID=2994466 RepID=UPI002245CF46|nr:alkaline phosphatase [Pedobacter sp. MR2016-24]MCX2484730.1 alkaline phosphatase [Pedobacter sp. MR2016-24]